MTELTQAYDGPGDDPQYALFFGFTDEILASGQFLIATCATSGRKFLAQVAASQLNLNRDALGQFHNTTINQLECFASGRYDRGTVVREVHLYKVRLLRDVTDGVPVSVRRRPAIASSARPASEEEVVSYLGLPPIDERLRLGTLLDSDVPICVSTKILLHHILIAGATGSGKSNTIANTIAAAQAEGAACIILDHKPDYQDMEFPNDEGMSSHFRGMENVSYWCLGDGAGDKERSITVMASHLDPSVLAASIFYNPNEVNQYETIDTFLENFSEEMALSGKDKWSWMDFEENIHKMKQQIPVDAKTWGAITYKLARKSRVPQWIRGTSYGGGFFDDDGFDLAKVVKPGRIIVIRVSSKAGGGRGYGLFLSYLLRRVYELKEAQEIKCPIVTVIDEAQDIFNAGRIFRQAAMDMLSRNIRKGRSMKIGYVIGVQSAASVPEEIRNNLNSQIIQRHNKADQAAEAMERAPKEQLALSANFAPGEALAYMFGANSVVHCQMRQSPFMLTKSD